MGEHIVNIECNGGICKVVDRLPSMPIRLIHAACSYQVQGYEHMTGKLVRNWDGYIRLFHKGYRTFPIGLLPIICEILDNHNLEYTISHHEYNTHKLDLSILLEAQKQFELRKYQYDTVLKAVENKIGVLRVATGGGKTIIAGHIISSIGEPTLFLVHTKDLLYQAIDVFNEMFGEDQVGQIGDGVIDIKNVTVATIQTMSRVYGHEYNNYEYDDIDNWDDLDTKLDNYSAIDIKQAMNHIGVVFVDECHRIAAPTAMNLMGMLTNPRFRFGLSASPWRDDGADLAIQACLGEMLVSISASDLTPEYLVPPVIRLIDVPPRQYPKATRYPQIYSDYIIHNEDRNRLITEAAVSLVHRRKPTMVLISRINHGKILQDMISEELGVRVPFISGKDTSLLRKSVLGDIRSGRLGIFIASTIADEGLDIKPLQGLILGGGGKSSTKALQRVGRILRPYKDKDHAEVIDFTDKARILVNHSATRVRLYETEPKWEILDC